MTDHPMDPGRDHELGDALRAALADPAGEAAFAASVRSRYRAPQLRLDDALAAWSRVGVAVAAAVVIAVLVAVWPSLDAGASIDDALTSPNPEPMTTLLTNESSPGTEILFTTTDDPR
jgi:hypothetical protein